MEDGLSSDRRAATQAAVRVMVLSICLFGVATAVFGQSLSSRESAALPELTQTVNDFAHVVDPESRAEMDRVIRALQAASGDVVVVATVATIEPFGDIREYIVKLFGNHGRGIGQKGKDNGLLILVALKERRSQIEVGYDLEQWITDGFAAETTRQFMNPEFLNGRYGPGLVAGTERVIGRIAQARNVTLQGVRVPQYTPTNRSGRGIPLPFSVVFLIFIAILVVSRIGGGGGGGPRYWGGGGWSGWSSGVGPFGGGCGGGGGGGGFGGGFGGFGGGGSGGGGGGSSW
jgi:uncharacterized protein